MTAVVCISITAAGIAVLLVAEETGHGKSVGGVAKMIASTAFLALALVCGALDTPYGKAILAGLVLSWFGDLFLIFRAPKIFLAGLISFFLGHVAYAAAFIAHGIALSWCIGAALALTAIAVPVLLWLSPYLTEMRLPVYAYIVIISIMVALSAGAVGRGGAALMMVGAVLFYISDLMVARDRFVRAEPLNRYLGLPLYYTGQVLLAYSVAAVAAEW